MAQIISPYTASVLGALQFQGRADDCGPFSTATVLNALCHAGLDGQSLAKQMNHMVVRGILPVIRRIPDSATFPWGMVDVFRSYHLKATWRLLASPELLQKLLSEGSVPMPIIGGWKPVWAHVMTLLAYDSDKNSWGFANTNREGHELFWLSGDDFLHPWKAWGNLLVAVIQPGVR